VVALLKRSGGATLQHLMRATGWQAHSVRGFISGALGKKLRLKIESFKTARGERAYSHWLMDVQSQTEAPEAFPPARLSSC
jgi:hypothetical protein